jgi:hypothetical protein
MKSFIYIICAFILSLKTQGQTTSLNVSFIDVNKIRADIENYVNKEINTWQLQGKFESVDDYTKRVTAISRQNKINELTNNRINEIASTIVHLGIDTYEYDPNNEIYKIGFIGLPPIYIKVPNKFGEATSFEKSIHSISFSNLNYTLTDQGFALLSLSIYNPLNNKTYRYNNQDNFTFGKNTIEVEYDPVTINIGEFKSNVVEQNINTKLDKEVLVDNNIPRTGLTKPDAFAVIIGNSVYEKTTGVKYASRDAQIVRQYLINVLGYKEGNIFYKENATKGYFEEMFGTQNDYRARLHNSIIPGKSDIFIYYSGHGAPGLRDKKGYFVPVECDPLYVELTGYSQELLIDNLSKLESKSVTLIIEACFSGANILDNISPIVPEVSEPIYKIENGVMLSSSKANQVSSWYNEMHHGMFTYFFLKGLQDIKRSDKNKDNSLTFQELFEYISDNVDGVPYFARKLHNVEQNPTLQGNSNLTILSGY